MANSRWRKLAEFVAFNGEGKQQTALGTWLDDVDLDTRDKCEIEVEDVVERGTEYNCDDTDIVEEPINTRFKRFRLTYPRVNAQILARFASYKMGTVAAPTGTPADEVQTWTRSGTVSGGTFTASLTVEGRTYTTKPIAWNATNAVIEAALYNPTSSMGRLIKKGDASITGTWGTAITITFGGRLAKWNLPLFVLDTTLLTGTTPDIVEAQTTAGVNKYHAITRSTDFSLPIFTFATGDKNGSVATKKYGDAVVESIETNDSDDQENVTMTVVLAGNYNADYVTGFSVPACINITPIKTTDCRLQINTNWETTDIVTHTVNLDNNVSTEAGFEYDALDFSRELQRGDKPTAQFTAEIYGNQDSATYILADNEATQEPVEYVKHYGLGGNRFSIIADDTKIKFQSNPTGFAGGLNETTFKIDATPYGISGNPVRCEAYIDQTASFLAT